MKMRLFKNKTQKNRPSERRKITSFKVVDTYQSDEFVEYECGRVGLEELSMCKIQNGALTVALMENKQNRKIGDEFELHEGDDVEFLYSDESVLIPFLQIFGNVLPGDSDGPGNNNVLVDYWYEEERKIWDLERRLIEDLLFYVNKVYCLERNNEGLKLVRDPKKKSDLTNDFIFKIGFITAILIAKVDMENSYLIGEKQRRKSKHLENLEIWTEYIRPIAIKKIENRISSGKTPFFANAIVKEVRYHFEDHPQRNKNMAQIGTGVPADGTITNVVESLMKTDYPSHLKIHGNRK